MSGPHVLALATRRLRRLIWQEGFQPEPETLLRTEQGIALGHPTDPAANQGPLLSLWLYRVCENEHVRNQVRQSLQAEDDRLGYPPLPLNLFYLLTPVGGDEETRQQILGRAMRVLHDHPTVSLADPNTDTVLDELHLSLARLSLEDTTRIWEALQIPFRLAVSYEARLVRVSSRRTTAARPITDRSMLERALAEVPT
jgi:hypothetical protein